MECSCAAQGPAVRWRKLIVDMSIRLLFLIPASTRCKRVSLADRRLLSTQRFSTADLQFQRSYHAAATAVRCRRAGLVMRAANRAMNGRAVHENRLTWLMIYSPNGCYSGGTTQDNDRSLTRASTEVKHRSPTWTIHPPEASPLDCRPYCLLQISAHRQTPAVCKRRRRHGESSPLFCTCSGLDLAASIPQPGIRRALVLDMRLHLLDRVRPRVARGHRRSVHPFVQHTFPLSLAGHPDKG